VSNSSFCKARIQHLNINLKSSFVVKKYKKNVNNPHHIIQRDR